MPAATLVLKNAAGADVTLSLVGVSGDTVTYAKFGASLLDTLKATVRINNGKAANRILPKLTYPSVGVNPSTGLPEVQWTEIGSSDLSSVLKASAAHAADFAAMWGSFQASPVVQVPFKTGNFA